MTANVKADPELCYKGKHRVTELTSSLVKHAGNGRTYRRCLLCKRESTAARNKRERDARAALPHNKPEHIRSQQRQNRVESEMWLPPVVFTDDEMRTVQLHACARAADLDEARMFLSMLANPATSTRPKEL